MFPSGFDQFGGGQPQSEQLKYRLLGVSMSVSDISDNVGSVKCVLGALIRALRRARHLALVESLP